MQVYTEELDATGLPPKCQVLLAEDRLKYKALAVNQVRGAGRSEEGGGGSGGSSRVPPRPHTSPPHVHLPDLAVRQVRW